MAHGGPRKGAGRKPGAVSKAKRELADMAKDHADSALNVLKSIMENDQEPASARVSAANAIIDRGYGKPPQALQHTSPDGTMTPPPTAILLSAATDDDRTD
jgi:hypothetical protein